MPRCGVAVASILFLTELFSLGQHPDRQKLKLRVIPSKDGYFLNERAFVNVELTNVSSETLCFPSPDLECHTTATGSLITTGESMDIGEGTSFICSMCGGGKSGDALEREIRDEWIKLAPNRVYVTEVAQAWVRLDRAGQWKLIANYQPPEGAFSDVAKHKRELRSAAKKVGCTLPEAATSDAEYITVNER